MRNAARWRRERLFDIYGIAHRYLLKAAGVEPAKLPPRSPNLNAYTERFIRSIKSEYLGRIIPIGERHLRHAIDEYVEHYNGDRPHQGLGNQLIDPPERSPKTTGVVTRD